MKMSTAAVSAMHAMIASGSIFAESQFMSIVGFPVRLATSTVESFGGNGHREPSRGREFKPMTPLANHHDHQEQPQSKSHGGNDPSQQIKTLSWRRCENLGPILLNKRLQNQIVRPASLHSLVEFLEHRSGLVAANMIA